MNGNSNQGDSYSENQYATTVRPSLDDDDTDVWNELPEEKQPNNAPTWTTMKFEPRNTANRIHIINPTAASKQCVTSQLGKRKMATNTSTAASLSSATKKIPATVQTIDSKPCVASKLSPQKRQIETVQDTNGYNDKDAYDSSSADDTLQKSPVITAPKTIVSSAAETAAGSVDFVGLERAIGRCIDVAEQFTKRQRCPDSDEVFGTLIASMVRELPVNRRQSARVQILELVGELLAKID